MRLAVTFVEVPSQVKGAGFRLKTFRLKKAKSIFGSDVIFMRLET
jgi:hypothetical protein